MRSARACYSSSNQRTTIPDFAEEGGATPSSTRILNQAFLQGARCTPADLRQRGGVSVRTRYRAGGDVPRLLLGSPGAWSSDDMNVLVLKGSRIGSALIQYWCDFLSAKFSASGSARAP